MIPDEQIRIYYICGMSSREIAKLTNRGQQTILTILGELVSQKVITRKFQLYDGVKFFEHTGGWYKAKKAPYREKYLHRVIWERANGPIPKGMHVHHIDHDQGHNVLENLVLISDWEHQAHHQKERADAKKFAHGGFVSGPVPAFESTSKHAFPETIKPPVSS